MQDQATPDFDEWVEYCFTHGYRDFHIRYGSAGYEVVEARTEKFVRLDPALLAQYIVKLFRSPAFVADRYTDDQIGDAVWFLFGLASDYFNELRSQRISPDLQIEAISSVATLYTDLFDRVCCERGTDPEGHYTNDLKVDIAVYMIWDMDQIAGAVLFPEEAPHLVAPALGVLETVLTRCRTSSCLVSALHGLGHIRMYHEGHEKWIKTCAERTIERFLTGRQIAQWVRDYASAASSRCIL